MLKKLNPLFLFILGFGIFVFTRLSKLVPTVPVAILISFIFILRFSRTQSKGRAIWLTLLGFVLSINLALWGLFELEGGAISIAFNLIRSTLLAVLYFLPFMTDRLMYPRLKHMGAITMLVFPVITTAVFYLMTIEGFFEGGVQPGKFVFGPLVLRQLLSLFGVFGFVFFTSWLVSVVNYFWENRFEWKRIKTVAITSASVVMLVLLFGAIKISPLMSTQESAVKVAGIIITPESIPGESAVSMEQVLNGKIASSFETHMNRVESLVKEAAANGTEIISFQELAILVDENNHEKFRGELKRIAVENDVYLTFSYGLFANEGRGWNKHVLIDNRGNVIIDYNKRYLVGIGDMGEAGVFHKGQGILQYADTPYGRITLSVCRDMEMAKYIIQAGKNSADIMFSSAYEFPDSWNPSCQERGIENGFSLVRVAAHGVSHTQDRNGRILNRMYFKDTNTGIMYSEVPTKGVRTLYPYIGHLIGQLCSIALLVMIVLAVRQRKIQPAD